MNKPFILAALLSTLTLFSVSSFAGEAGFVEEQWYIAPMGTYVFKEDTARNANNGAGLHLGLGRGIAENWAIELNLLGNKLTGSNTHDIAQFGVGIDLLHSLNVWDEWSPYLVLGTGFLKSDSNENGFAPPLGVDSENAFGSAGFGMMHKFGEKGTAFRTEVRYRADFANRETYGDWLFNLGFALPVGGGKDKTPVVYDADNDGIVDGADLCPGTPAGASVDANGCEPDSDKDGVKNSKDRCPNTPIGTRVDANGCAKVADSDGDGVIDAKDKCPRTPAGSKVDQFGCVVIGDSDGDGVLDNKDRCPNTKAGARVDASGCEFKAEIKLPGVRFELNSARLTPESLNILQDAVTTLTRYTDVTVEAEGHTDSTGNDSYNMRLSQQRAESVRDYIVAQGISASRITARGHGETQPVADNSSLAGRKVNRRVTLRVTSD